MEASSQSIYQVISVQSPWFQFLTGPWKVIMLAWKLPVPTGVSMIGLKSVLNIAVYEYKVNLKMERSHKYTKYSAENTKVENHEILTRIIFV